MSDIYGYGGDPSYGGGTNLGGILGALASLPKSLLQSLYQAPGIPTGNESVEAGFPSAQGPIPPRIAPPMSAAQIIGNAPQINTAGIPQTQQPPIMGQQLTAGGPDPALMGGPSPSPIATGGQGGGAGPMQNPFGMLMGGLGNIRDRVAGGLAVMNPQAGGAYYGRMGFQAIYQDQLTRGASPGQAMAIASSPQLQQQVYGLPQHVGDVQMGKVTTPVFSTPNGPQMFNPGGGQGFGSLQQTANEVDRQTAASTKLGESQGAAAAVLPSAKTAIDNSIATLDRLNAFPNRNNYLGAGSLNPVNQVPGTPGREFSDTMKQFQGQVIQQTINGMKSAGLLRNPAVADQVSKALTNLGQATSPKAWNDAYQTTRNLLLQIRRDAETQAGQEPTEYQPPAQAQSGAGNSSGALPNGWSVTVR